MPTSILSIPVDDEAFKAFLALFDKYKTEVQNLTSDWGEVDKVVAAIGAGFAAMSAANEISAKASKEEAEAKEKQRKEAEKLLELERKRKAEVHQMWEDSAKIAKNMASMTLEIFKWVGFGGLFGAGASILGGLGLDRMAMAVSDQRRTAAGFNLTPGQLVGMRTEFGRYTDVNALAGNVSQMQFDPASAAAFNLMGIKDPTHRSVEALMLEVMQKIGPAFKRLGENPMLAHAYMLDKFVDFNTMRRMAAEGGEINPAIADYRRRGADWAAADKDAKAWQDFLVQLDAAKAKIFTVFVRGLEPLIGPMGNFADSLADIVKQFTESDGFKQLMVDLRTALADLADSIKSGEFEKNLKEFFADFGQLTDWVHERLIDLGIIKATDSEIQNRRDSKSLGQKLWDPSFDYGDYLAGGSGYGATDKVRGRGPEAHVQAGPNFNEANSYLRKFDVGTRSALLGNITGENSSFNPFAEGDFVRGKGMTAFGLGQWHGDRQALFRKYFGHRMQDTIGRKTAIDEQLKFMLMEIRGDIPEEHGAHSIPGFFHGGHSTEEQVAALVHRFEASKHQASDIKIRTQAAREITVIVKAPAGASTSTTAKAAAGQS